MMLEQLKSKFGDCKFQEIKPCSGSYENHIHEEFCIFDPPNELNEPVKVVTVNDEHQLKVTNNSGKDIYLVKTDKCLFPSTISKCDCLLFNENVIYFIEIKSVGVKSRGEQRRVAAGQLGATIELFRNENIDLSNFAAHAITCFKSVNDHPVSASKLTLRATFKERYSIDLKEGNKIEF